MLAAKTFLKDVSGISVLLQLDNATAVAYINNMGGTVSCQLTDLAKELWMWALNRDIILTAQHILSVQHRSRHRIADNPRQVRLDALSPSLPSDHGSIWTTGCGPVCVQIDTPDTPLLQLETRSPGTGSGCVLTGLGSTERVCQPTVVLCWQS